MSWWQTFVENAERVWPFLVLAAFVIGVLVGIDVRGRWARSKIDVRPVVRERRPGYREIVGWRAHLGRYAISERTNQGTAEIHAEHVREQI